MTLILPDDKPQARKIASGNRLKAHEQLKEMAPVLMAQLGFPVTATDDFKFVSAFFPTRSEIDTRPLLQRLIGEGWTTCLPVVVGDHQPLIFRRWQPGEPTEKGAMNIDIPVDGAAELVPDVLIVPMLAFDRKGYRLGYGGGFYDRTLTKLRAEKKIIAIGAAYAAQETNNVPHHAHDQHLDYVITERGVIQCG